MTAALTFGVVKVLVAVAVAVAREAELQSAFEWIVTVAFASAAPERVGVVEVREGLGGLELLRVGAAGARVSWV